MQFYPLDLSSVLIFTFPVCTKELEIDIYYNLETNNSWGMFIYLLYVKLIPKPCRNIAVLCVYGTKMIGQDFREYMINCTSQQLFWTKKV